MSCNACGCCSPYGGCQAGACGPRKGPPPHVKQAVVQALGRPPQSRAEAKAVIQQLRASGQLPPKGCGACCNNACAAGGFGASAGGGIQTGAFAFAGAGAGFGGGIPGGFGF